MNKESQNIEWKSSWRDDFPEEALREAVLNAIVHNDYTSGSPIQIRVYNKMIWISNFGNLPIGWIVETLKKQHKSIPPNPDIANAFFRARYIEVWGRGTLNIINYRKKAGLPEPDFKFSAGLTVLFKKENIPYEELATINYKKTVEKTVEKILKLIKNNPKITIKEIEIKTGLSRRGIEWNIAKLKRQAKIKRVGPDKGGHWEIINND